LNSALNTEYDSGFAKEIALGDINLFTFLVTNKYFKEEFYFIQKDKRNPHIQVRTGKNKFRKKMKQFLVDKNEIHKKVDFKKINYSSIESIIKINYKNCLTSCYIAFWLREVITV
jgi:hypothetical protein